MAQNWNYTFLDLPTFKTTLLTRWFSGVLLNIYKDAKSIAPEGLVKDTAQVNFDDFKMLRSTRGTFQLNREKEKKKLERMSIDIFWLCVALGSHRSPQFSVFSVI